MAVMTILKHLPDLTSKLLKTFYFTLTCDNAFLTTPFSTGKTKQLQCKQQNFVVYTVNTRPQKSLQTVLKMSCSFR